MIETDAPDDDWSAAWATSGMHAADAWRDDAALERPLALPWILPDEKAATCSAFFARALECFAEHGITVERVMTDNHWSYTRSNSLAELLAISGIAHKLIKPHCPWQNGKVERFNRTLQIEWAYRQVFTSNDERTRALDPWLDEYNTRRRHSAIGGKPPISRLPST